MDAVEFFRARDEMCKKSYDKNKECLLCDAYEDGTDCCIVDVKILNENSEQSFKEAVEVVENWVKSNPKRTRLQDFLEKFPNAKINEHGFPKDTCCMCLGYCESCDKAYPSETDCYFCWKKELED